NRVPLGYGAILVAIVANEHHGRHLLLSKQRAIGGNGGEQLAAGREYAVVVPVAVENVADASSRSPAVATLPPQGPADVGARTGIVREIRDVVRVESDGRLRARAGGRAN